MKIINNHDQTVFFRFFRRSDDLCLVGFDEGIILPRRSEDYFIAGVGRAKLEIWEGCGVGGPRRVLGPTLVDNADTAEVDATGNGFVVAPRSASVPRLVADR